MPPHRLPGVVLFALAASVPGEPQLAPSLSSSPPGPPLLSSMLPLRAARTANDDLLLIGTTRGTSSTALMEAVAAVNTFSRTALFDVLICALLLKSFDALELEVHDLQRDLDTANVQSLMTEIRQSITTFIQLKVRPLPKSHPDADQLIMQAPLLEGDEEKRSHLVEVNTEVSQHHWPFHSLATPW